MYFSPGLSRVFMLLYQIIAEELKKQKPNQSELFTQVSYASVTPGIRDFITAR
jgi:hypothetical protein